MKVFLYQYRKIKQKFPRISATTNMKKFSFIKCGSSRYFYQVLWQFLISGFRFGIFGQTLAAAGGEMRPNYFKYTQPARKGQCLAPPQAGLGNQIVRNFGQKNQLAVLF